MKRIALAVLALVATPTFAATTSNIDVTATVSKKCDITASPMSFGDVDAFGASATTTTSTVSVTCTAGTSYTVALSKGAYSANAAAGMTRAMSDGNGHYLSYDLFTTNGHVDVFDVSSSLTGNGAAQALVIFGRVPPQVPFVGAGVPTQYADTVVASVVF